MDACSFALPSGLSSVALRRTFNIHYTLTEVFQLLTLLSRRCFLISTGYTFRRDGRYFVLAERHKSKDTIGVYDAAEEYRLARVSLTFSLMFSQSLMTSAPDDLTTSITPYQHPTCHLCPSHLQAITWPYGKALWR